MRIAGVDGCRDGWFVVIRDRAAPASEWQSQLCRAFRDVLALRRELDLRLIAVDIPIGLLDEPQPGGRDCDRLARRVLGYPRRNSVFSPPSRRALQGHGSFRTAQRLNAPAGLTKQTFALFPKLRDVDDVIRPNHHRFVREVHPELSFYAANGGVPMRDGKKSPEGRRRRIEILGDLFGPSWTNWFEKTTATYRRRSVAIDDILDASIAVWTAERIGANIGVRLPANPPIDGRGLPMEIWY